MMRTAVLTYHHTTNYGAALQSYALTRALRTLGHDPYVVDYRPAAARRLDRPRLLSSHVIASLCKRARFHRFARRHVPRTARRYLDAEALRRDPPEADALVCGSDEIWHLGSQRGVDLSFFLDFLDEGDRQRGSRRIAYAPSFGTTTDLGLHAERIGELLGRFDYLSVRDQPSAALVRQCCGREAPRVLDPTFLIDFNDLVAPSPVRGDYLLVYARLKPTGWRRVQELARRLDLPVVSVANRAPLDGRNFFAAGPEQWLSLMAHARFVVTSYYHGLVFSIIFRRDFVSLERPDKSVKVRDLAQWMGLEHRVFPQDADLAALDDPFWPVDYTPVEPRLEAAANRSADYLREALHG